MTESFLHQADPYIVQNQGGEKCIREDFMYNVIRLRSVRDRAEKCAGEAAVTRFKGQKYPGEMNTI